MAHFRVNISLYCLSYCLDFFFVFSAVLVSITVATPDSRLASGQLHHHGRGGKAGVCNHRIMHGRNPSVGPHKPSHSSYNAGMEHPGFSSTGQASRPCTESAKRREVFGEPHVVESPQGVLLRN